MMLFMAFIGVTRATEVEIGDGTTAQYYVPIGTYYNYSITEQLYTADEIGMAGTINSISFHYAHTTTKEFNITVYMANVDAADLSTGISLAEADEVFSGSLSVNGEGWVTIDLDSPFAFDGTSNLLIGINKTGGSTWYSGNTWYGTTATNMARYTQQDSGAYTTETTPTSVASARPNIIIDITPGSGPTCDKPDTFAIYEGSLTSTSVTLTWEGGSGNYNFEYKKSTDDEYTVHNTSSTAFALDNLEPGTAYNARVQSVCTDGVSGYKTLSFKTMFGIPLVEAFGTAIPDGWALYNGLLETILEDPTALATATYGWNFGSNNGVFDDHARANIYGTTCKNWLAMPAVLMEDNVQLRFDVAYTAYSGSGDPAQDGTDDKFVVVANVDGEWTILRQWDNADVESEYVLNNIGTTPITVKLDLSAYAGKTVQVAFYAESTVSNADNNIHIDNVSIDYIAACETPSNLAVNYEGGTTATVTWADADYCDIDVNGTVYENKTSPFTLEDLEPATVYEVTIRQNCGATGTSDWSAAVTFFTDCTGTVYEAPYSCGFESDEDIMCWTVINTDAANIAGITTDQHYSGDACFQFTSYSSASSYDQYLITPELDGQAIKLSFVYARYASGDVMKVGYSTTTNDITAFTWGDEIEGDTQTWLDYNDVFPEGTKYVAFWYYGDYAYYLWVDDFNITVDDGCRIPTDFRASNLSGHTADLSWTENGEATQWVIVYMAEGDEEESYALAETNPFTFEGLEPTTTYYAMVTPYCGDMDSWSDVITWTTLEACPAPRITVEPYPTSATVSWTGFADNYSFEWAEVPDEESKDGLWLQYDNSTYSGGIGNSSANTWTWGVMYPTSMLAGNGLLSKVAIYENSTYNTEDITINIYSGGDDAPETLIYTETVTPEAADAFHEITLSSLVTIDPTQNLWITLTEYGTYVISYCENGDNANNDWVDNGGWAHIGDLASSLAGDTWMIRGYVEPSFDPDELDWQPITGATSPVTLDGLTPEHEYVVRIKALCGGDDGESSWAMVSFWTPSACTTPKDLNAEPAARTAKLSWTGYTESFDLKYRYAVSADPTAPAIIILEAHDVWEDGSGYQMLLDPTHSTYGDVIPESGPLTAQGTCDATPEDLYDPFAYTIPENADPSCDPVNFVFDGSVTIEIPAGTYDWCIVNPSSDDRIWIAGTGDIAGRYDDYVFEPGTTYHFTMGRFGTGDGAALEIERLMSDWITVENVTSPYTLTGLTPLTYHEWQVQGLNCSGTTDTEWSDIESFFTTEETTVNETIELVSGFNWITINVDITLEQLEAAINEALPGVAQIQIISQGNGFTTYNGRMWRGSLTSLDVNQMYKIKLPDGTSCEIVLNGMPIATDLPITINPGNNWIIFPLSESMAVNDAFAGYNAISGDKLSAQESFTTYNGRLWRGGLTTLMPGQGYMYNSKATEPQTLIFPTSSKKSAEAPTTTTGVTFNKTTRANQMNTVELDIMAPVSNRFSQVFNKDSRPIKLNVDIKKK